MLGALLSTLARPRWWAMSLAAFLVRGGVLLVLLPILALPSIAGLAATFGQVLVGFVFGEPSTAALVLAGVLVLVVAAWLVASANVGAWLDVALAGEAADDEDLLAARPAVQRTVARRAATARLLAHLPTAIAIAFAAGRIIDVGYAEFVQPGDPATPILLRVVARAPEAVLALAVTTLAGEAAGGIAVRFLLTGASVPAAIARGYARLIRPTALATFLATNAVLVAIGLPYWAAVATAWEHARIALVDGGASPAAGFAIALFLATWLGGIAILSVAIAWRATAWTAEVFRATPIVLPPQLAGVGSPATSSADDAG
jgi:hypothetical protein